MKCYKLELANFDDRDARAAMYQLAVDCQHLSNRIWQLWEAWHVTNDTRTKLIECLEADAAWRDADKKTRGERPKWSVECFPKVGGTNRAGNDKTLRNAIEADLMRTFPQVHTRIRTLQANLVFKTMSDKDAGGKLQRWIAVLLNHQARMSFTRPLPIPFDKAHSQIVPGAAGENAILSIRLHRDETGGSVQQEFRLKTTGRAARYVTPIVRMASGEWAYKGSKLWYDSSRKKWFAMLSVDLPAGSAGAPEPGRVAFLRCGLYGPTQLRIGGRTFLRGFARGASIGVVRRQLLTQRWSRQENYRNAGSSNKGHGRNRAMLPVFLLSKRWKDFVKRYNHNLTTALVNRLVADRVETLIYFQPAGGRFLDTAGKIPGREDSSGWDYFQIKTMLAYKCQDAGIGFTSVKSGVSRTPVAASAASGG